MRKKQLAQQDKGDRHTTVDPEMGKTEFLGERGTSVLSIIPEMSASFMKVTTIKVRTRVHHP